MSETSLQALKLIATVFLKGGTYILFTLAVIGLVAAIASLFASFATFLLNPKSSTSKYNIRCDSIYSVLVICYLIWDHKMLFLARPGDKSASIAAWILLILLLLGITLCWVLTIRKIKKEK